MASHGFRRRAAFSNEIFPLCLPFTSMKALFALLPALCMTAHALAQGPLHPEPAPTPDQPPQLAPPPAPDSDTDATLIPTTPPTTTKGDHDVQTSGFVKPVFSQKSERLDRTRVAAADAALAIRFRQDKSKALLDPVVQDYWHQAEKAHTDYERRLALQKYYTLLYDNMAKVAGCTEAFKALVKNGNTLATLTDHDENEIANILKRPKSDPAVAKAVVADKQPGEYSVMLANARRVSLAHVTQTKLVPDVPPAYLQSNPPKTASR
jgi:hypothetical protein